MLNKTYNINDISSDELHPLINSFEEMRDRFIKNYIPFHIDGENELEDKYYPRFWEYASVIHYCNLQKGMKVLDAGSGYSLLSPFLTELGLNVWANDVSVYWRERKKQMKELGKDFKLDIYNLTNTNYPDNFFDNILCVSVIEHIPEEKINSVLLELNRILKIGGTLAVTFDYYPQHIPYGTGEFHGGNFCSFFSFDSIKKVLLNETGFDLIDTNFVDDTDWNVPPLFNQYNFARIFLKKVNNIKNKKSLNNIPVRIGHISFDFFYGGIQEQIQILAEHSKNEKIEHLIIACGDGPLHEWADLSGIPHAIISKNEIAHFCMAYRIDIVFSHIVNGTTPDEHLHVYELFIQNIPLINVHYCSYIAHYPKWLFDQIITNASSTIQYLPKGAKYSVIPLAINTSRLDTNLKKEDIRKKWNIPNDALVIGRLSRLEPTKMVEHTIFAMKRLKEIYGNSLFFFIGGSEALFDNKGWYENFLKNLTLKENIGEIVFTGPIYGHRKAEFLHLLDINLAPTSFEGYGLIFVEPAYCGVPTVTYDHCANAEVVGEGGIVVPFADMDSLVESTITLLKNPEIRREMGCKAKNIVESRNLPIHWCSAIEKLVLDNFCEFDKYGNSITKKVERHPLLILISRIKILYFGSLLNMRKVLNYSKKVIKKLIAKF